VKHTCIYAYMHNIYMCVLFFVVMVNNNMMTQKKAIDKISLQLLFVVSSSFCLRHSFFCIIHFQKSHAYLYIHVDGTYVQPHTEAQQERLYDCLSNG